MTKNNDVRPCEKENKIRNSKRIVFVVFAYHDLRLLGKLLHFLDHESSWVFLHWDRTTSHSLKMPQLHKAKLTFVSPQQHISWGGNGVMMAQEKILRAIAEEDFSHVLFLTEDSIPLMTYDRITFSLWALGDCSLEIAQEVDVPRRSLVNFLPKNAHRKRSLLASLDFRMMSLWPRLNSTASFWRGRAWVGLSRKHVSRMVRNNFFLSPQEYDWLKNWSLLSEEFFLQTALFRGFPEEIVRQRVVLANYQSANPGVISPEEIINARRKEILFARKSSLAAWKFVNDQ